MRRCRNILTARSRHALSPIRIVATKPQFESPRYDDVTEVSGTSILEGWPHGRPYFFVSPAGTDFSFERAAAGSPVDGLPSSDSLVAGGYWSAGSASLSMYWTMMETRRFDGSWGFFWMRKRWS